MSKLGRALATNVGKTINFKAPQQVGRTFTKTMKSFSIPKELPPPPVPKDLSTKELFMQELNKVVTNVNESQIGQYAKQFNESTKEGMKKISIVAEGLESIPKEYFGEAGSTWANAFTALKAVKNVVSKAGFAYTIYENPEVLDSIMEEAERISEEAKSSMQGTDEEELRNKLTGGRELTLTNPEDFFYLLSKELVILDEMTNNVKEIESKDGQPAMVEIAPDVTIPKETVEEIRTKNLIADIVGYHGATFDQAIDLIRNCLGDVATMKELDGGRRRSKRRRIKSRQRRAMRKSRGL